MGRSCCWQKGGVIISNKSNKGQHSDLNSHRDWSKSRLDVIPSADGQLIDEILSFIFFFNYFFVEGC